MIAEAVPPIIIGPDWTGVIAAIAAAATGLITLWFNKKSKDRQEATDEELRLIRVRAEIAAQHAANASQHAMRAERSVQESRQERTEQIATLTAKVDEGISVSNNYNGKIAESTSATQAIAEEMRQMRVESQPQPPAK